MNSMPRLLTLLAAFTLVGAADRASATEADPGAAVAAPAVASPYPDWSERGRLLSWKRVRTLSRRDVREALFDLPFADTYAAFGLEDFFDFYTAEEIDEVVKSGIRVYQVVYETIDFNGRPTTASGAVLVPRRAFADWAAETPALLGLQRGTIFYDLDAPSYGGMPDWGIWRGLLPAAAGYVTAMPDNLGFGAARHLVHPYTVAEPTANAGIDMLRAARRLAEELGVPLRDEVFLAGLSQGASATLATQRLIEANYADEFQLAGVAPSSGAYLLSAIADFFFRSEVIIAPQLSTLIILAYNEIYDLGQPLSYYFRAPYDVQVPVLHDKQHDNQQIIAGLPTGPAEALFTDAFLASYRGDGEQGLKAALQANDVHTGWTPVAPVRLLHGELDSILPVAQSHVAFAGLSGPDTDIEVVVIEGAEHLQTIVPSTLYSIRWFDSLLGR